MRSLLGRFHRPMSRGLVNNMLTMNNLGDGSTLSLDFTTGVLDPRLTFSRASTATFVNSSGYVEWAGANLFANSNFAGTSIPTSWTAFASWDGTIPSAGTRRVTTGGTAAQKWISYPVPVSPGIKYSISVYVSEVSGQHYANTITPTGAGVVDAMYLNGVSVGLYATAMPGLITVVFSNTSGTTNDIRIGIGATGSGVVNAVCEFSLPRAVPGNFASPAYIENTTASSYHAPRFDYSPTNIGEPRGLLVEGVGINLTTYSEDFENVNWTKDNSGGSAPVVTTVSATNPANGSTVNQIVFDKTGGVFSRIGRTSTGTASTPYTMSVWMRTVSGSANVGLRIGADAAGFNCAVTTTWKRFQYTYTLSSTDSSAQIMLWDSIIGNDETATVYAWGCQVEAGSGASSYIPTGASQVTRNADLCYMSDISSLSYSATNGSMFYEGSFFKFNSASYPTRMGFLTAAGGDPAFEIFVNGTTIFSGIRSVPANNEITRTIATNTNYKFATSFNAAASSQVRCSINGAAVVGSGSSALTATRTPTVFGFTRSGYELYFPSGTIKSAKYWNTTLTDADLVSKST